MIARLVLKALLRQRRRSILTVLIMAVGLTLATAMLVVVTGLSDKVNRELKAFGANLIVTQKTSSLTGELFADAASSEPGTLDEAGLAQIKTIFWSNNIVDFAPYLETTAIISSPSTGSGAEVRVVGTWFDKTLKLPTGESVRTGMKPLKSWWTVQGRWTDDADDNADDARSHETPAMLGASLARRLGVAAGGTVTLKRSGADLLLRVTGVAASGGSDDDQVFLPLAAVQRLTGQVGRLSRIEVSAITTPENELARKAARNPRALSGKEWDTWYCTAYVGAIAFQLEEAIPDGRAKPVRQVSESEGIILGKTQSLMLLITLISLVGTSLGIANLVGAGVTERSREIGLLKALGATDRAVAGQILLETAVWGFLGGIVGYFGGQGCAQLISQTVFGSLLPLSPAVAALVVVMTLAVTLGGCLPAIRGLLSLRPAEVLHGR